jgi:hypothetical protein
MVTFMGLDADSTAGYASECPEDSEWNPDYLRQARAAAEHGVPKQALDSGDAVALAVRELAAEVRALRHALCGPNRVPPRSGALGE